MTQQLSEMPATPAVTEFQRQWRRLNPWMIIVRPIHEIAGLVPVLVIFLVLGKGDQQHLLWSSIAIGLVLIRGLAHWARGKYRITGDRIELHSGLIVQQRISTRLDRIRTVETTAKFGHRMFGLVELRIGTGEHAPKRANRLTLDAIKAAEAQRLRAVLLHRAQPVQSTVDASVSGSIDPAQGTELARIQRSWLRYAPLSLSGVAAVGAFVLASSRFIGDFDNSMNGFGPARMIAGFLERASIVEIIALVAILAVIVLGVISFLGYLIQFWNYRLTRETNGTLLIRRGLFTTRSVSLEEAKLRGVIVREQLFLRLGHGARLSAIATGLDHKTGSGLLMPPAPKSTAQRVAAEVLHTDHAPTAAPLTAHPHRARWRRLSRAVLPTGLLTATLALGAVFLGWPDWPWQVALILLALARLVAVDRYRALGHAFVGGYLVTRSGSLRRKTVALQAEGIIGWRIKQSVFQRKVGLATLTATTAAGHGAY
ncbi:MAG: PH domain-containing protein, partial [Sciscionella sp.]|nr:PH domain-containing protein [Sciscionella sp.]